MPRVIHFELGTVEPERGAESYRDVIGWKVEKWGEFDYWLITTGEDNERGINGALMVHQDAKPRTVNTVEVPSVEDFAEKVTDAGGQVASDKVTVPGVGYNLYCRDVDGNLFGLHQTESQTVDDRRWTVFHQPSSVLRLPSIILRPKNAK